MSADKVRMHRSRHHAYQILFDELRCGDTLGARWALGRTLATRFVFELETGNFGVALRVLPRALALDGWGSLDVFWLEMKLRMKRGLRVVTRPAALLLAFREPPSRRAFADYDPLEGSRRLKPGLELRRIERMAEEDRKETERRARIAEDPSETSADVAGPLKGGSGAWER